MQVRDISLRWIGPAIRRAPLPWLLGAIAVVSMLFLALPGLDTGFSSLFYAPGYGGFPASIIPALILLRDTSRIVLWLVGALLLGCLIVKLALPRRPTPIAPAAILFLVVSLALGPGLLVNTVLKDNWGRPRPVEVTQFGGTSPYVPVWEISDACPSNCSFVSGEASSGIWLTALAVVAPAGWRRRTLKAALAYAAALSLNRIAFGGHFLSDVLLAWLLTLVVIVLCRDILLRHPPSWLRNERLEQGLTALGLALRALPGRLRRDGRGASPGAAQDEAEGR